MRVLLSLIALLFVSGCDSSEPALAEGRFVTTITSEDLPELDGKVVEGSVIYATQRSSGGAYITTVYVSEELGGFSQISAFSEDAILSEGTYRLLRENDFGSVYDYVVYRVFNSIGGVDIYPQRELGGSFELTNSTDELLEGSYTADVWIQMPPDGDNADPRPVVRLTTRFSATKSVNSEV